MPHIPIDSGEPGIRGLFAFRPETAGPLNALAEVLLRGDNTLTRGERELIAAYVSGLNECRYCTASHAAFAAAQLPGGMDLVDRVRAGTAGTDISRKLQALLAIAAAVQRGGREVSAGLVAAARAQGATDREVHDTVLIAAAFCMFNRYVDGLATHAPDDPAVYATAAERVVTYGYGHPAPQQAGHAG
ncbi:carboxymuconolactone decarboxylase family protein [Nonomuraea rubra]|uniref:carboxymuconolactone decarboxylase family protein n=1 Tax=Nonomuraea rubra TaxID=46180 RepID=UPI0033CE3FBD